MGTDKIARVIPIHMSTRKHHTPRKSIKLKTKKEEKTSRSLLLPFDKYQNAMTFTV